MLYWHCRMELPQVSQIVTLFSLLHSALACLQNLPRFNDYGGSRTLQSMGEDVILQALIPAYYFNCSGNVTEWRAFAGEGQQRHHIEFQVWKQLAETVDCYTLVGSNEYVGSRRRIVLDVPASVEIQVKPGYVVGLSIHGESSSGIQLDTDATDIIVEYYYDDEDDEDDEGSEDDGTSVRSGKSDSCGLFQGDLTTAAPVITAVVATSTTTEQLLQTSNIPIYSTTHPPHFPHQSTTPHPLQSPPTTTPAPQLILQRVNHTSSGRGGGSSSNVILIGAIGGTLAVILTGTIVTVACVCIIKSKRRRKAEVLAQEPHEYNYIETPQAIEMKRNQSYVTNAATIPTVQNQSYTATKQFMEENTGTDEGYDVIEELVYDYASMNSHALANLVYEEPPN